MDISISVSGCDEISALLKQLPSDLMEKWGRRGLLAAAEITVMAVQGKMPIDTGTAFESIAPTRIKLYPASGTLFTAVEPKKGFKRYGRYPRKYMHLIEGGRKALVPTNKKAMHPALGEKFFTKAAAVAPHPVFQPARDSVMGAAKVAIEIELEKGIAEFNNAHPATSG